MNSGAQCCGMEEASMCDSDVDEGSVLRYEFVCSVVVASSGVLWYSVNLVHKRSSM